MIGLTHCDLSNPELILTTLNVTPEQLIAIHDGLIVLIEQYQDDAYVEGQSDSKASEDLFLQNAKGALALVSNAMF